MKQALIFCALLAALTAQTPSEPSPSAKLDMFAGNWSGDGTFEQTPYSKTGTVHGTNHCAWSEGKVFLICQGTANVGGAVQHGLSIYNYNEAAKTYRFLNINPAGANRTLLSFAGDTWTYDDEDTTADGKKIYWRTRNIFESADRYRFITEFSFDRVHWVKTGSGASTRIP